MTASSLADTGSAAQPFGFPTDSDPLTILRRAVFTCERAGLGVSLGHMGAEVQLPMFSEEAVDEAVEKILSADPALLARVLPQPKKARRKVRR